jgi:hypothetical protein
VDTFHTCATQMLKEFRALLHISPIPINSYRLLQLLSLNMYAIDCNGTKSTDTKGRNLFVVAALNNNGYEDFSCDYCYCLVYFCILHKFFHADDSMKSLKEPVFFHFTFLVYISYLMKNHTL